MIRNLCVAVSLLACAAHAQDSTTAADVRAYLSQEIDSLRADAAKAPAQAVARWAADLRLIVRLERARASYNPPDAVATMPDEE